MVSPSADVWTGGDAYEAYVGRWSRLVAHEFLDWLAISPGATWLDIGCGTGALTEAILEHGPARVDAVDSSPAYVQAAGRRLRDPRVTFGVADARKLPGTPQSVDVAVSGLVLNFVPQPDAAVNDMGRVLRSGGIAAVYVWDYAQRMDLMRHFWDAAVALDPNASELDEGRRFPICQPDALDRLFRGSGLHNVESRAIDVRTRFRDFDDYWQPFLGGQGPAPGYAMSLDNDRRTELRERIRAQLPIATDGSIDLVARAWAVRGTRR
jgi:trans-aconitate methyltransferase